MANDATIRPATADDVTDVVRLLAVQFAEHRIDVADATLRDAVAGMLADGRRGTILVAVAGERAVGVAVLSFTWTLEHGGQAAWLDELYVEPAERDRGVGRRLLDAALAHARDAGAHAVDLEIDVDHTRVASLYRRAGFAPFQRTHWTRRVDE
jgi:ribosomal protein S18 acetylase RimI-like enzyme